MNALDLFAGPGGWDLGARAVGVDPLGIEWDDAACQTREAAGLRTTQADVAQLDPRDFAPCELLIASPPCQAWSMAGQRGGERDKEHVIACLRELAAGSDTRAEHTSRCEDARSMLVVEPLRWVLALKPRLLAFEQVPPVLGLWTLIAGLLEPHGWKCWAGVLEAERYGVPQTRERAILMGSRDGQPHPPRATHQRYVPGEPQRHDVTLEGEVLPWVSMAQALGWDDVAVPAPTVTAGGGSSGGPEPFGRGGASADLAFRLARGAGMTDRHDVRWVLDRRQGGGSRATRRSEDGLLVGRQLPEGEGRNVGGRNWTNGRPASTEALRADGWPENRPGTTIAGDPRVFPPGGHHIPGDQSHGAVRVTVQQAAILQTFPPDHPWQGSRSKQFEQVGNAVPPLLAKAILSALLEAS